MASILDGPVYTGASSDPADFPISTGANRLLLVFTYFNGAGDTQTAGTAGGQTLLELGNTGEANSRRGYVRYMLEAAIAARTSDEIDLTYVGSPSSLRMHHIVVSLQDAPQSAPIFAFTTDTDDPQTLSLTALENSLGLAFSYNNEENNDWVWGNSWIRESNNSQLGGTSSFARKLMSAGAETISVNPDLDASANFIMAVQVDPLTLPSTVSVDSVGPTSGTIFDNELRVSISGLDFEATQGSGTVVLHDLDPSEATPTVSVTQTVRSWSDTEIVIDVDKGAIVGDNGFIEVTTNGGAVDSLAVVVLDDTGTAPAVRSQPPAQSFTEDVPFSFDASPFLHHSDVQDSLTFSATGLPPGLSIDSETGSISGVVADGAADNSPYAVAITITDSDGADVTDNVTWTINSPSAQFGVFLDYDEWRRYRLKKWRKLRPRFVVLEENDD